MFYTILLEYHTILKYIPDNIFNALLPLFLDQRPYLLVSHSAFKQLQTIKYTEVTQGSKQNFVLSKKKMGN